eukprot:gene3350-3673_t
MELKSSNPLHNNEVGKTTSEYPGVTIDVVDLTYGVVKDKVVKRLLKNISLSFKAGSMCALMGPSGAGKSTLLDMIADRKLYGFWSGEIYIDGKPRTEGFRLRTAYVLQDDVHIPTLTVEESLYYSAWTRVPSLKTPEQIQERVDTLLNMMGLTHVRRSIVGDSMTKGISGGQMKRLSIAIELVNLPDVIFLDEPTSGLDSSISLEVMGAVKDILGSHRLCVSTIHQPSPEVFALFDKLVLLSAGRLVYSADTKDCVAYFTNPHMGYTYIEGENPAEFVIAVGGGKELPKGYAKIRQPEDLEMMFKSSKYFQPVSLHALHERAQKQDEPDLTASKEATSVSTQFHMLMSRSWLAKIRDYADLKAQLFKNIVVGIMIGIVFQGQGKASEPFYSDGVLEAEVNSVNSILFFSMMFTMVGNLQAIPYLCSQLQVYRRELASHAYVTFPYWITQIICTLPLQFGYHCIFVFLIFFLVELPATASYFIYYLFLTYFMNMIAFYSSLWLAAATNNEALAFSVFPLTFLFVANFSGYSITLDSIPAFWCWAPYLSYGRWGFEGLMVNEWSRYDTDDSTDDANKDGNGDILEVYGFEDFAKENCFWILPLYMAFFAGLTYYCLLPPVKKLNKVAPADISVSAAQSFAANSKKYRGSNTSQLPWGDTVSAWMKESLIGDLEGGGADDEEEVLEYVPRKTTDFFRVSTGVAPVAQGCQLTFRDIDYVVTDKLDKTKKTQLLTKVSGQVFPGEMCALMGASGAGKSTLLDVLSQRKNTGEITGEILYNQSPVLKNTAYVMQDNIHIGLLTVKESLYFAAQLRLPEEWSVEKKEKRIQKILDMLGLQEVANTIVGTEGIRGISVMSAVRNLANQNRTVIATIHQPSRLTFELFDKVLILAKGRVCYFGGNKRDHSNEAVDYFTNSPWQFYYRPNSNPADFVIAVAGGFLPASDGRAVTGDDLADYYTAQSKASGANKPFVIDPNRDALSSGLVSKAKEATAGTTSEDAPVDFTTVRYNTSTWHQIRVLTYRTAIKLSRDRKATVVATLRHVFVGLFYGSLYYQLAGGTSSDAYSNRSGIFFFSLLFMIIGHQQAIPTFLNERLVFYRERGAKAYGAFSYWVTTWILQVPLIMANVFLYALITYWMVGLRADGDHFGYFYLVMMLCSVTGLFNAGFVSSISASTQAALSFFPCVMFFAVSFAGFLIYLPQFPAWLGNWAPYISFMRFAMQGLTLNEFQDNSDLELGDSYIDQLGYQDLSKTQCAAILLPFICFYAGMFLLMLKFVDFEER